MTDLHALIHRMADELDHYRQLLTDNRTELHPLATEARTALAEPEPEPEGPTDEELIQLAIDTRLYRFQATAGDPIQYETTEQQIHAFARAVLARWGDGPAVSGNREPASVDDNLALRVQRLEAMRETEKAALLDAFKQIDKLQGRLDFQYTKLCRLEEAAEDGQA